MRRAVWALGLGLLLEATTARAQAPVSVWYRTSEGCPDGSAFVARLSALGTRARLASVGDRVDFVVTLGSASGESSGRLERQTRGGTVAIREYRDPRCEQVAEALALTLELALEPSAAASGAAPDGVALAADPLDAAPVQDTPATRDAPASSGELDARQTSSLSLGLQGALTTGVAPSPLPGVAAFVELTRPAAWIDAARASLVMAYGRSRAAQREIEVLRAAARLEACVSVWGPSVLDVGPCLAAEGGVLRAAGEDELGAADVGAWAAALAHVRAAVRSSERLSFELQVGAMFPLVRYQMGTRDGGADWYRTGAVGLDAAVGAALRFP